MLTEIAAVELILMNKRRNVRTATTPVKTAQGEDLETAQRASLDIF